MGADSVSGAANPELALASPPRYGRRAVWAALAALAFVGLSFCLDEAASYQLAASEMPTVWALYLAGVALYYAAICAVRWFLGRRRARVNSRKDPPCQSAADIL